MEDEKITLWDLDVVKLLGREVGKLSNRVRLLMRQYVYQETNIMAQKKILPLLCEYYVTLNNYKDYLKRLAEEDNIIVVEKKKSAIMTMDDIKVLQVLSSSRMICERDLSTYSVSIDVH